MDLAQRLHQLSDEKHMTQADVARKSGLSTSMVAHLFVGRTKDPRISTLLALCAAFDMLPEELLEGVTIEP